VADDEFIGVVSEATAEATAGALMTEPGNARRRRTD